MRAKKWKGELELSPTAFIEVAIAESPATLLISIRAADLESGEDSCDSVTSDAGTAKAGEDDVLHIAQAVTKVCAKSPEFVIEFVR
uniref:Uncharacterized protein n=1 Tax=Oryza punctata TaxID=4537 RepID=A0A0E0MMX5_ORYPU